MGFSSRAECGPGGSLGSSPGPTEVLRGGGHTGGSEQGGWVSWGPSVAGLFPGVEEERQSHFAKDGIHAKTTAHLAGAHLLFHDAPTYLA